MSSLASFSRLLSTLFSSSSQPASLVPEPDSGKLSAWEGDKSRASDSRGRDEDAAPLVHDDRSAADMPTAPSATSPILDLAQPSSAPTTPPRPSIVKFASLRGLRGLSHRTRILHLPHSRRRSSDSSDDGSSSDDKEAGSGSPPVDIPTIIITEAPTSDSEKEDKEKSHVATAEHASLRRSSVIFNPSSEPAGDASRLSVRTARASTRASTRTSVRSGRTRRTRRSIATSPGSTSLEHTRFTPSQLTALSRERSNRRFGARLMHHDHHYPHRGAYADSDSDEDVNGFLSESSLFSFSNADTRTLSRDSLSEYEHGILNTLCFCLCWSPRPRAYEYDA
ncbi:hypothetical protein CONPUDRAFT_76797 [Coniophora puteana RWD-64-598 SS2]|uniref:Uncharacterized protein n=1 Tax=Coniophora puteana (strain RWD-64-598) TaxID=741705 RepID=A0A5M3MBR9_CONPW|nr:uncharacterized protein CONPUDRAFT_76797 [Coniophora puteana RWD-64-598 SS2]EIW76456.1 hypothetical protein CONPUDRAFT_76797 [Coniophora puteana RWD-64-598 SS2]